MTKLNALFARYFIGGIIFLLVIIILLSNYITTIFFTDFLTTVNLKSNEAIIDNIQGLLINKAPTGFYKSYLKTVANEGNAELTLYKGDIHVFSSGPETVALGPNEKMYEKVFKEDEATLYTYKFLIENEEFVLKIYRVNDIRFIKQNVEYLNRTNLMYLSVFILAVAFAIVLSLLLAKKFNQPILTIRENINYIKKGKYKNIKKTTTKARELQELSNEINLLAASKEQEENLRKRLSSDIVHELKTPITALSANLEAILDGIYKPDQERIKVLLDQTNRLARLVNGLSKLTILETNAEHMSVDKINLSTMLHDIFVTFEPSIKEKGLQSIKNIKNDIYILGNEDKLLQSFVNIISNALKYTEYGSITVSLEKTMNQAVVTITDTGIGIDEKDLPFVFERFYRSDISRSRQTGGAGIGLAITKAVIAAHDGEIAVNSVKGQGSTFITTLDLVK
ncbi:MAG: hypothetical protein KAG94_05195 [Clostridiales bacterium]|nr:hypothetical protein [Clostridiales bacterium]